MQRTVSPVLCRVLPYNRLLDVLVACLYRTGIDYAYRLDQVKGQRDQHSGQR